jgi:hypothetical protein
VFQSFSPSCSSRAFLLVLVLVVVVVLDLRSRLFAMIAGEYIWPNIRSRNEDDDEDEDG